MNKPRLYQLYDLKAETTVGPIMIEKRDGPAIRNFTTVLGDARTLPGQYPEHFELRFLGSQDEETAQLDPLFPPQVIATGAAWLETRRERQKPDDYDRADETDRPIRNT